MCMGIYVLVCALGLGPENLSFLAQESSENKNIKVNKTAVVYSFEGRKRKFAIAVYGTLDIAIRCAEATRA